VQRAERLRKTAESQARQGEAEKALATQQSADSLLATAELADPNWVRPVESRAHGSFRRAFFRIGIGDFDEAEREIERGLDHAERALALDPGNASALEQRGVLRYLLWLMEVEPDQENAERLLARARADLEAAVQADERRATAYSTLSHLYSNVQEPVSVILSARRAYEEDAYLSNIDQIMQRLFWAHYDLEQFNDAKRWCDEGAARFPDNWQFVECQLWLLLAPSEDPAVDRAWELKARLDSVAPENLAPVEERIGFLLVGGVLRRAGLTDSAESVFQRGRGNEEIDPLEDLVVNEARIRAATGDTKGGMDMLRRYIAANPQHDFIAGGDINWMWRNLRDEPEFQALIRER
jgi:serine/threonine-protein kinase